MIIKAKHHLDKTRWLHCITLLCTRILHIVIMCGVVHIVPILKIYTDYGKKLIRIISNIRKWESASNMFDELGIIEFVKVNLYLTRRFMFRWNNRNIPVIFHDFLPSTLTSMATVQGKVIIYMRHRLKVTLSKFGIRYRGVIVWNALLKLGINPDTSEAVFSKTTKACIKNNLLRI